MSDHDRLIERVAGRNPMPYLDDPPSAAWDLDIVRHEVMRRDSGMQTIKQSQKSRGTGRRRTGWQVAAAVFVAVLFVGIAIVLLFPGGDDVVEPIETSTTLRATTTSIPTTSTTEPPSSTTTLTPTTLAQPSPPLSSSPSFAFFNSSNPVTEPGAVVFDQAVWHMFYRSVSWQDAAGEGDGRNAGIGHATSADGRRWTDNGIVTTVADTGFDFPGAVGISLSSAIVLDDGTWVIYFHTFRSNESLFSGGEIGRMTAPAPIGPWTSDAEPLLLPGPDGAWDANAVAYPAVLRVGQEWWMYYDGNAGDLESVGDRAIGLAVSQDGLAWTKYDNPGTASAPYAVSDPVLTASPGEWDEWRVLDANVVATSEGFVMAYATNGVTDYKVGLAFSDDGIQWTKSMANPVYDGAQRGFTYGGATSFIDNGLGYVLIADLSDTNPGDGATTQIFTWFHEGEIRE